MIEENKIAFIVQARMGSTRMPNKILLPFYKDQSILLLLIDKLSRTGIKVLIATPEDPKNDVIESLAKESGVMCYRGSENDVLKRFIDAADNFGIEHIIRVCSDNPFLDFNSLEQLISEIKTTDGKADYISFNIGGTPSIKTHYGFWTEYVSRNALKKVAELTDEKLYHEHVTNYIYEHNEVFNIKWIDTSEILTTHDNIRLTIDTKDDFASAQTLFDKLYINNTYPSIVDLIQYLDKNPQFYSSMENQIIQNSK